MTTSPDVLMHEAADDHSSPSMTMALKRMILMMMTTMMMRVMRANFCEKEERDETDNYFRNDKEIDPNDLTT